jgi:hypothetical protein
MSAAIGKHVAITLAIFNMSDAHVLKLALADTHDRIKKD